MEYLGSSVMIMSCSNCNVNCNHCYISYKGNMTPNQLIKIATTLKGKYKVMLNGAEPLTNMSYLGAYPYVEQSHILTNGLSLIKNYEYVTEELRKHGIGKVLISYHFDIHDIVSSISKRDLENLFNKLNYDKFKTVIMTTITSQNYTEIEKYCHMAHEMGAAAIKFTNFLRQGNAQQMDSQLILSEAQKQQFFYGLSSARKKYSKEELTILRCGSFGVDSTQNKSNFNCPAGKDIAIITPDLNVYPCIFLSKKGNEIGRYENGKIELFREYQNDGTQCLACKQLNEDYLNR